LSEVKNFAIISDKLFQFHFVVDNDINCLYSGEKMEKQENSWNSSEIK